MATQQIVHVRVANAAKVGGVVGVAAGLVGSVGWIIYLVARTGVPEGQLPIVALMPILGAGVVGLDGVILGALAAWLFNLTTTVSGGLVLELKELPPGGEPT